MGPAGLPRRSASAARRCSSVKDFQEATNLRRQPGAGWTDDDARTALDRLQELQPELSVAWIQQTAPWTALPMAKYVEGMRKAGS